uniref:Uncharacterized protein n=1 Tax=Anguilla anguilla TaxID=7936 RepID=A0A0E9QUV1_ANGAN
MTNIDINIILNESLMCNCSNIPIPLSCHTDYFFIYCYLLCVCFGLLSVANALCCFYT